jgi:homoserine kinase
MEKVKAFAPASVANVGCGFDIMGFALGGIGDVVTARLLKSDQDDKIILGGKYGTLVPSGFEKNTAGVAVRAFLMATGNEHIRLEMLLEKNLPLGSGLGSSASSAVAGLVAVNELTGNKLTREELIPFAMEGERIACGTAHADNVAPSLLGGFVLIRNNNPPDIIKIGCPEDLYCAVIHPHITIKTSDSRRILKQLIPISDVTKQTANVASFTAGLMTGDFDLIGRSMSDLLAEPKRTQLIPGFEKAKKSALAAGATGCGISGSGPSVFALCRGKNEAEEVAEIMYKSFLESGLESDRYISGLNEMGAHVL